MLRFEISDTGIGMTEEQLGRLFLPFMQADGSMTRRFGGTGLGLAIAKQLVELMGGEIGAESTEGQGSTFWFRIPLARQEDQSSARELDGLRGLRVLAVDDNATNLTIVSHYLQSWGIQSESVSDGFEALRLLRQGVQSGQPFAVVILDMQMPQIDGLTLARLIKADPSLSATELLMISSVGQSEAELSAAGVRFSLSKPIRQSNLHDALAQMVCTDATRGRSGLDAEASPETDPAPTLSGRLLLVEDNQINQRVALSMLKRLGLDAEVADDGQQALALTQKGRYNLILMDCQMPNMDGFEASAELRRREQAESRPRTVIVALTANAMQGDRERCIAAGMDDYIPKPLKLERLRRCLERWLPPQAAHDPATGSSASADPLADALTALAVDPDAMDNLKDLLGEGYGRFLDLFADKTEELMRSVQLAVDARDGAALAAAAHALKGSAGNLGASELFTLAQRLEQRGRTVDFRDIERLIDHSWQAHRHVLADVARLRALEPADGAEHLA
jgi:CheY-like chemotaxis protein/HPt (histidine-containing phosphotransfer) domain-containing protein